MNIVIHRIYNKDQPDGFRILVDRLWPRGIAKERAALDGWYKDLAPSTDLRRWFNHDDEKWDSFKVRYWQELTLHTERAQDLLEDAKGEIKLILLYGAKSPTHNHAIILKAFLEALSRDADKHLASPVCYASDFENTDE